MNGRRYILLSASLLALAALPTWSAFSDGGSEVAWSDDRQAVQVGGAHEKTDSPGADHASSAESGVSAMETDAHGKENEMKLKDDEWRERLTPEQYRVIREKGTERAFTGAYWNKKDDGTYVCAACGNPLFTSEAKFDSGTGWPSYTGPVGEESVGTKEDRAHGMNRTEVVCKKCEAHLGHVFADGPAPNGLRYCINSVSLDFQGEGDGDLPEGPPPCEIPPGEGDVSGSGE